MADKGKKTIVNNIKELNLEIDYDKLAEAIVKAQKKSEEKPVSNNKNGFWKTVWLIIINKEEKTGTRTSALLASVMGRLFNGIALIGVLLCIGFICAAIFGLDWTGSASTIILQAVALIIMVVASASLSFIFRGMANEINQENDRNYIMNLFFGLASLASLIVALVALFQNNAPDELREIVKLLTEIKNGLLT